MRLIFKYETSYISIDNTEREEKRTFLIVLCEEYITGTPKLGASELLFKLKAKPITQPDPE